MRDQQGLALRAYDQTPVSLSCTKEAPMGFWVIAAQVPSASVLQANPNGQAWARVAVWGPPGLAVLVEGILGWALTVPSRAL